MLGDRGWLNADVAALPPSEGGLAIPDLASELKAMAATVVQDWALEANEQLRTVGDLLFAERASTQAPEVYITPEAPPNRQYYGTSAHYGKRVEPSSELHVLMMPQVTLRR